MKNGILIIIIALISVHSNATPGPGHFKKPIFIPDNILIQKEIEEFRPQIIEFLQKINTIKDLGKPLPIPQRKKPYEQVPAIFDLIRKKRNVDLLEIIIAKKLPLEQSYNYRPLIHELIREGKSKVILEIIRLYKKYNINIKPLLEAKTPYYWTPLICAAAERHTACVKVLLENGADITAHTIHNETALHYAVKKELMRSKTKTNKMVKLLCQAGVPLQLKDSKNFTAREIACKNNLWQAADIIDYYTYLPDCKLLRSTQQTYFALLPEDILMPVLIKAYAPICQEKTP